MFVLGHSNDSVDLDDLIMPNTFTLQRICETYYLVLRFVRTFVDFCLKRESLMDFYLKFASGNIIYK